jgi:hypothetical protein
MKKSKFYYWFATVTIAIMMMGCPYSSEIALSEATTKAADNLIGTWELSGSPGNFVEVKRAGGNSLEVTKTEPGYEGSDPTVTIYKGHLTDVNGTMFLNVKEDTDYASYYFYKLAKDGDFKMTVYSVTANVRETFTSSDEMKKFFASNMQNSYFYDSGEETYYKIK